MLSTARRAATLGALLTSTTIGLAAFAGGASAASGCTTDPITDPNLGVYACYDYAIQDSDPSNPGAELSTAAFVDVDVFGQARIFVGRFIVGGQVNPSYPTDPDVTAHRDGLGARIC